MHKIHLTDEDGEHNMCYASNTETPRDIMRHFHIGIKTKTIFMNGKILSAEKMDKPLPENLSTIYFAVRTKTATR